MPEIMITAGTGQSEQRPVLRERVTAQDLESDHFAARLVERVGWALLDADEIEHQPERVDPPATGR